MVTLILQYVTPNILGILFVHRVLCRTCMTEKSVWDTTKRFVNAYEKYVLYNVHLHVMQQYLCNALLIPCPIYLTQYAALPGSRIPACLWHSNFVQGMFTLPAACPHGIQEFREILIFNSTGNDTNLDWIKVNCHIVDNTNHIQSKGGACQEIGGRGGPKHRLSENWPSFTNFSSPVVYLM